MIIRDHRFGMTIDGDSEAVSRNAKAHARANSLLTRQMRKEENETPLPVSGPNGSPTGDADGPDEGDKGVAEQHATASTISSTLSSAGGAAGGGIGSAIGGAAGALVGGPIGLGLGALAGGAAGQELGEVPGKVLSSFTDATLSWGRGGSIEAGVGRGDTPSIPEGAGVFVSEHFHASQPAPLGRPVTPDANHRAPTVWNAADIFANTKIG